LEIKTIAWVVVALIVGGGYAALVGDDSSEIELVSISVDGVQPTADNIKNGSYSLNRNIILVTNGEPTGLAAHFINWIRGAEGQAIVAKEGFADLDPADFDPYKNSYTELDIEPSGVLKIAGSTTILSMMIKFTEAYTMKYDNVRFEVSNGGSGAGATLSNNTVDIGMLSRDLTPKEAESVIPTPIAKDGVVMVVDKASEITNLTTEQVVKIFNGEITNWSQVGGKDLKISPKVRDGGSGTRVIFDTKMTESIFVSIDSFELNMKKFPLVNSNGTMLKSCMSNPGSIGYINLGSVSNL